MRERRILTARREGNQIYYSVRDRRLFEMLDLVRALFCHT
jgi:DNA-binding transcriptional ArsR family regulator